MKGIFILTVLLASCSSAPIFSLSPTPEPILISTPIPAASRTPISIPQETAIPSNGPFAYPASGTISMVYQQPYVAPTLGLHAGIDITSNAQQPVFAVYDGLLARPPKNQNAVNICHQIDENIYPKLPYHTVCTYYAHIELVDAYSSMSLGCEILSRDGKPVKKGELIGYISTNTSPPHLHFSIKKWNPEKGYCWESEPIFADLENLKWQNMLEPLQYFGLAADFYDLYDEFP